MKAWRIAVGTGAATLFAIITVAATAAAQECSSSNVTVATQQSCNALLQEALLLQPQVGIGLTAGNPLPGASSTLGMRIGSVPRISLAARLTGAKSRLEDANVITSLNVDAAVGLFSGVRLAPTVGGFGSIDLIASAGKMHLPGGVSRESPGSWALGVRLGVLRESFTAPGISITGAYRHVGDMEYELPASSAGRGSYALADNSVVSVRGIIGKRLFVLGAAAGIGFDKYTSDVSAQFSASLPAPATTASFSDQQKTTRKTIFVNVSWTMLILNLVAEGGWQEGGDSFMAVLPASREKQTDKGIPYGSLAIRLAL